MQGELSGTPSFLQDLRILPKHLDWPKQLIWTPLTDPKRRGLMEHP